MDYTQDVFFLPRFDFVDFLNTGFLSDCTLIFGPDDQIKAHVFVLANSSEYFYNTFTGEMQEANTRNVEITRNPQKLLKRVIRYMYTGRISYEFSEMMSLYSIAKFYQIKALEDDIKSELEKIVTKENLYALIDQCFDNDLSNSLKFLEQFITKYFFQLDIKELTEKIDVETFANSIATIINNFTPEKLLSTITEFLGEGYEFKDEQERNSILNILDKNNKTLNKLIRETKPYWIPEVFMK